MEPSEAVPPPVVGIGVLGKEVYACVELFNGFRIQFQLDVGQSQIIVQFAINNAILNSLQIDLNSKFMVVIILVQLPKCEVAISTLRILLDFLFKVIHWTKRN
jgi:hypothetical protein